MPEWIMVPSLQQRDDSLCPPQCFAKTSTHCEWPHTCTRAGKCMFMMHVSTQPTKERQVTEVTQSPPTAEPVKLVPQRVNVRTSRTVPDIVQRLDALRAKDFFGFQSSDLLTYLAWDSAKQFLKGDADEQEWRSRYPVFTPPLVAAKDYLPFAWDKANNCRGISAYRSMEHMKAWLWLAGFSPDFVDEYFDEYAYYGKPQLVFVSTLVGYDWRKADNMEWRNTEEGTPLKANDMLNEVTTATALAQTYDKAE